MKFKVLAEKYRNCPYCDVPMAPDKKGEFLVCSKDPKHKVRLPDKVA